MMLQSPLRNLEVFNYSPWYKGVRAASYSLCLTALPLLRSQFPPSASSFIPHTGHCWRVSGSKWISTLHALYLMYSSVLLLKIDVTPSVRSLSFWNIPFDILGETIPSSAPAQCPEGSCFSSAALELGAVWVQQISVCFVNLFYL